MVVDEAQEQIEVVAVAQQLNVQVKVAEDKGVIMEERRKDYINMAGIIRELKDDVSEIKKMLLGNGKIGVVEMARRSFDYMLAEKANKSGLLTWTFRVCIGIVLGYIAMRVGLK